MMNPLQGNASSPIDHQERRLRKRTNPKESVDSNLGKASMIDLFWELPTFEENLVIYRCK
jgi:hypothetical protein